MYTTTKAGSKMCVCMCFLLVKHFPYTEHMAKPKKQTKEQDFFKSQVCFPSISLKCASPTKDGHYLF